MIEPTPKCKLSTILAADVFGFSKKMGENEEGTLRNLKDILGEDKDYMQPAEFVIDHNLKKVISCTYSDGRSRPYECRRCRWFIKWNSRQER